MCSRASTRLNLNRNIYGNIVLELPSSTFLLRQETNLFWFHLLTKLSQETDVDHDNDLSHTNMKHHESWVISSSSSEWETFTEYCEFTKKKHVSLWFECTKKSFKVVFSVKFRLAESRQLHWTWVKIWQLNDSWRKQSAIRNHSVCTRIMI